MLAEVYGLGKSERFIRDFQRETNTKVKVATKFAPLPWRFTEESPVKALKVRHKFKQALAFLSAMASLQPLEQACSAAYGLS